MTASLHETDFFSWSMEQAALLKSGRLSEIDVDLLAEEVEDMGKEICNACFSFIRHILEHFLKLRYSAFDHTENHWRIEIANFRIELDQRLTKSIANQIELDALYRQARRLAITGMREEKGFATRLPALCPWTLDQVRDEDYWPDRETP